jgi:tripartite-type tricarboxylate transporter receptor subunit TctC
VISRRAFLAATALLGARSVLGKTTTWPERVVRIIVPFPAGGAADVLTRIAGVVSCVERTLSTP